MGQWKGANSEETGSQHKALGTSPATDSRGLRLDPTGLLT